MERETWKDIAGYEGLYQISTSGRVRSLGNNGKKPRIMVQEITIWGYCRVRLYDAQHRSKHYAVHRLVAAAFIGDCEGYDINHKNEIKTDNRLENLEIVTRRENCNYGTRNQRVSRKHLKSDYIKRNKVAMCDKKTHEVLRTFSSCLEAERETSINNGHISACCLNKRKSAGGFEWRLADA